MEPEQINSTPVKQSAVVTEEQTKKPSKLLVYLLFILIILGLASWAGVYLKKENVNEVEIVNETDNWKTYRNEEYGFEFKYPQDWKIDDEGIDFSHVITISHNDAVEIIKNGQNLGPDGAISISVYDDQGLDINKFVVDFLDLYLFSKKDLVVNGISSVEAINGSGSGFPGKHVYIPKNNKVFMIGGGADNMREDVFYKILSTLKFKDITDISTWKTYRNEEYGFEFKYPEEAVIPGTPIMSGNTIILEIGMSNGIFILPKGESDYGYDKQPIISDVEIGGLKAKKQLWESDQRIEYKIIHKAKNWIPCGKDLKNCNRISIQWETKEQLEFLNQILSTFRFINDTTDVIDSDIITMQDFITCINKKATLYGTFWSPHTLEQNKILLSSSSVETLKYVECSTSDAKEQTQICKDKKIMSYPIWEFSDGSRVAGKMSIEQLGLKTSCEIPNN